MTAANDWDGLGASGWETYEDFIGPGDPRYWEPERVARREALAAATLAKIAAMPDPEPDRPWRPSDPVLPVWNRSRSDWDLFLCDPETGELLRDTAGQPVPAPTFDVPPGPEPEPEPRTWRTLADISDEPPRPLLFGMFEDGPNLAYGPPGVGKGTTGAWIACEAQGEGLTVAIFDAERRPREWSRRVSGLGGDRSKVVYIEPSDLGPKLAGRPLWEVAPAIGTILRAAGVDLFMVDSILPAVGVGEERLRSDAQAPFLFVGALDALGIPSVSFGHPPKGQPEGDPFGSMAWLAAMRMTWIASRGEGDEHRIRWRPRKRNERGHVPGVLLTIEYGTDGRPCKVTREDDEESTRDWLLAALIRGARSVADLATELLEEAEEHTTDDARLRVKERLSRALRRMSRDGWVTREGPASGPAVKWSLRLERLR